MSGHDTGESPPPVHDTLPHHQSTKRRKTDNHNDVLHVSGGGDVNSNGHDHIDTDNTSTQSTQPANGHTSPPPPPPSGTHSIDNSISTGHVVLPVVQDAESVTSEQRQSHAHNNAVSNAVTRSAEAASDAAVNINETQNAAKSALGLIAAQDAMDNDDGDGDGDGDVYDPDQPDVDSHASPSEPPTPSAAAATAASHQQHRAELTELLQGIAAQQPFVPPSTNAASTSTAPSTTTTATQQYNNIQPVTTAPAPAQRNVYVASLPPAWTSDDVCELFETYGPVEEIQLLSDTHQRHVNRGIAFVHYKTHDDAVQAVEGLNGMQVGADKPLEVKFAKPRERDLMPPKSASTSQSPARNTQRNDRDRSRSIDRSSVVTAPSNAASTTGSTMQEENTVYISHMPRTVERAEIERFMRPYAPLHRISIPTDSSTGRSKGIAFVKLASTHAAERALNELNGKSVLHWTGPIQVRWATKGRKDEKPDRLVDTKQVSKSSTPSIASASSYQTTSVLPTLQPQKPAQVGNIDAATLQQMFNQFMQQQQQQQAQQQQQQVPPQQQQSTFNAFMKQHGLPQQAMPNMMQPPPQPQLPQQPAFQPTPPQQPYQPVQQMPTPQMSAFNPMFQQTPQINNPYQQVQQPFGQPAQQYMPTPQQTPQSTPMNMYGNPIDQQQYQLNTPNAYQQPFNPYMQQQQPALPQQQQGMMMPPNVAQLPPSGNATPGNFDAAAFYAMYSKR